MRQPEIKQPQRVFTEAETAARFKVKIFTIRKWRREGSGPRFIRCGGRLIRYAENDISEWLAEHTFRSNANELQTKTNS